MLAKLRVALQGFRTVPSRHHCGALVTTAQPLRAGSVNDHRDVWPSAVIMRRTAQQHSISTAAYASAPLGAAGEHAKKQQQHDDVPPPALWLAGTLIKTLFIWMGGIVGLLLALLKTGPRRFFHRIDRRALPIPTVVDGQTSGFVRANGVDLFYVRAGQGPGKKLMLFVHGFPENWYTWRHQLRFFAKDYDVVAFNMRGYGPSQVPSGVGHYTIDTLAADVADLIKQLGHSRCILVAHDWGAGVAWTVARSYPQVVERLVSVSVPPPDKLMRTMMSDPKQANKSSYMFLFQLPWVPEQLLTYNDYQPIDEALTSRRSGVLNPAARLTAADIEQFKMPFSFPGSMTAALNYYRANLSAKSAFSMGNKARTRVTMPVLQLWADNDVALEPSAFTNPEEWAEDITSVEMTTCSHWIPFDRPDEVNTLIKEFVEA